MNFVSPETKLFATSAGGSVGMIVDQLCRFGPSWSVVPPLLIGAASVIGAVTNERNSSHRRRLEAERQRAELLAAAEAAAERRRPWPGLTFDQLEGRSNN